MNDFTKEELQEILENIEQSIITTGRQRIGIVGKLQSMIDEYCDHDFEITYRMKEITECHKCGLELYNDKKF